MQFTPPSPAAVCGAFWWHGPHHVCCALERMSLSRLIRPPLFMNSSGSIQSPNPGIQWGKSLCARVRLCAPSCAYKTTNVMTLTILPAYLYRSTLSTHMSEQEVFHCVCVRVDVKRRLWKTQINFWLCNWIAYMLHMSVAVGSEIWTYSCPTPSNHYKSLFHHNNTYTALFL